MIKNEQNFLIKDEKIYELLEENEVDFSFDQEIKFFTKFTPKNKVFIKQTQSKFVQVKNGKFDKILDDLEIKFDDRIGFLLKKKIFSFTIDGVIYEISEFGEFLSPVCILSAKFDLETKLDLPEFLKKIVIKEIKKSEYSDERLALFGNPDFKLDFKNTIKRAKKADDISLFSPGFTKTSQIIQIVFVSKFALLKRSLDRYLQNQKTKNLLKIKNNFESIIVLLDKFEYMLNKRIVGSFKKEINYYLDQIYEFQNENYLKKWLNKLPYKTKTIEKRHKNSSVDKLIILFGSERIKNNFDNFELILQSDHFFTSQKAISNDTRIVISRLFRISALNALKNLLHPKFNRQMWQSVFEFRVFCELFLELFTQKGKKISKKLSKIVKLLELNSQANFANDECERLGVLAESDTLKTKNLQVKIKQKTPNLFKKIHKLSKSLKIYYSKEI